MRTCPAALPLRSSCVSFCFQCTSFYLRLHCLGTVLLPRRAAVRGVTSSCGVLCMRGLSRGRCCCGFQLAAVCIP